MTTTSAIIGGLGLLAFSCGLFIPSRIQRRRARRRFTAEALARAVGQRDKYMERSDRYAFLYHEAVKRNAALLEHIGDEREAAASQALADSPAYFEATAAREAKSIDREWFDLATEDGA